ncbi:FdtA/QdtA family cupin domain-containing protein [Pseudomonas wadenswilerensis]|uniref:sugar 3,4-ketoisomerase n=1 Tax=Pseudomonas wadenswilerensis TaxID=1785161 RepID=UPI000FC252C7
MSLVQWIEFQSIGDDRGALVSLEGTKNIPFDIRRVYYMTGLDANMPRGFHAHKDLQQVIICLSGSFKLTVDDGKHRESVTLDSPAKGVLLGNMLWREMHDFSEGCVLMVVASNYYIEDDYIRSYSDFVSLVRG